MSFLDLTARSDVHVRLRPPFRIAPSPDGTKLLLDSYGTPQALSGANPHFSLGLPALHTGAPLAALRDLVLDADGARAAAGFLLWLQRLARLNLLDYPLVGGERVVAVVQPQRADVVPLPQRGTRELATQTLSRFAFLRRAGDTWLLEHPLCGARVSFPDLSIVSAVLGPDHAASGCDGAALVRDVLATLGFMDAGAAAESPKPPPRIDALKQWDFHDLAFHFHSRRGWHVDPFGGIFPHIGDLAPQPALRPSWQGDRIPLDRAPADLTSGPLSELVHRRRSHRAYADAPTLGELGVFLDRVARVQRSFTLPVTSIAGKHAQIEIATRPYPNGGASYELEIYPVVAQCDGLEPGLFHYDAGSHELVRLSGRTPATDRMLVEATVATAGQATPQILLAITARFARVMWKYKSIAYAVILRNAGVLYQTMYLTATDMGLSPCGLGSGNSALFASATGLDPVIEGTVGEFLLGGRPRE